MNGLHGSGIIFGTGRILLLGWIVFGSAGLQMARRAGLERPTHQELSMKRTVVSYRIKSDRIDENTRLLKNVFAELEAKALPGVHYVTLQTGDGWYTHFTTVETEGVNPI